MSIQNKRVEYLTEMLLQRNLQNGMLPDSKEFIWQLNQAMRDARYDKPSFKFKPYRNTEIVQSSRYNTDNDRVYNDLLVLYRNIVSVHQLLNKQYQRLNISFSSLVHEIVLGNVLIGKVFGLAL